MVCCIHSCTGDKCSPQLTPPPQSRNRAPTGGDDEGCDVCGTGGEVICCFSEGVECRTVRDETCSDILRGVVGSASSLAPSLVVAAVAAVAGLVALLSIEL